MPQVQIALDVGCGRFVYAFFTYFHEQSGYSSNFDEYLFTRFSGTCNS